MAQSNEGQKPVSVQLDLNNEAFQADFFGLHKDERNRVIDTLKKVRKSTWDQVYRDAGLKWERVTSVPPPKGIDSVYSLRITHSRRAIAIRQGNFMRLLTIEPDHDATYGKK